jgi:hypothetical protein
MTAERPMNYNELIRRLNKRFNSTREGCVINPGATIEEMVALKDVLGRNLPPRLVDFYTTLNGFTIKDPPLEMPAVSLLQTHSRHLCVCTIGDAARM